MVDRNMSGAMLAALAQPSVTMCHLLDLELAEPVYLTDAAVRVTWSGRVYEPTALLSVSDVVEGMDMTLERATITLAGADQSVIAVLLLYEYLNRPGRLYTAVLTDDFSVIADPNVRIAGRLDSPSVTTDPESGTCTASIDIVSRWSPLGRKRGRYTNSASQSIYYPTDRGFDRVHDTEETIVWGKRGHRTRQILAGPRGGF